MPVQHTLFGRPIPHITARRIPQLLALIAIFAVVTLVFTLPSAIPVGPSLSGITQTASRIPIPKIPSTASKLNPFRPTAHAPAIQENSTSGDSSWYSNWNWLSPFSSSVTLDERRSLLPPLPDRPPIYIYYDHTVKKDAQLKSAEHDILLTWRKAWWAQGFRPIILGPPESMRNPLYEEVQRLRLEDGLQHELSRWLAWENMGNGILCHHLTLPMGAWEDPLLSYLRRGEYPKLTRYDGLSSGIFSGSRADVTAAVKLAIGSPDLAKAADMIEALPQDTFTLDSAPESVAYYDEATIKVKYVKIAEKIQAARPAGLLLLNQLINSHLHNTWQNIYSSGIAVLKPLRTHMTAVVEPALEMAQILAQCPESPILSSCPPNRPKCRPCVSSSPMKVATPPMYRNTSTLYTIGTVPHPYTLTILTAFRDAVDIPFIRRQTSRDSWLTEATKESLGTGVSSSLRLIKFKEAVASPYGKAHSLWFTAERATPLDLSWHFGFSIAKNSTINDGRSEPPVPGPERRPTPAIDLLDGPLPPADELERERTLLTMAKEVRTSKRPEDVKLREAAEAWNLADMEAWRFARAFLARSSFERSKWEDEEKKFAGGAGAERAEREGWGRWFD